jgi:hypothetical protein
VKKLLIALAITFLLFAGPVTAQEADLTINVGESFDMRWAANGENDLAGYRIREATAADTFDDEGEIFASVGVMARPYAGPFVMNEPGLFYFGVYAFDNEIDAEFPTGRQSFLGCYGSVRVVDPEAGQPPRPVSGCVFTKYITPSE